MAESIGRREHGGAVHEHGALAATDHELAGLPIFADLAPDDHSTIVSSSSIVELTAGEWLFRQDEPADGLYVVRSGRLEVLQDGVVINELGQGAILCELGLLTGAARSAPVRARRDAQLLRLPKDQFDTITMASRPRWCRRAALRAAAVRDRGVATLNRVVDRVWVRT